VARKSDRTLLGVVFVLIGGLLLAAALFLPWYSTGIPTGSGGFSDTSSFYLGLPWSDGTVRYSCTGGSCSSATSYSDASLTSTGELAAVTLMLVNAAGALGVIVGALGLRFRWNSEQAPRMLGLAVTALVLGIVATELFALTIQFGFGGPWSSFWGSGMRNSMTGAYSYSWGPSTGWYLSNAAAIASLAGVVLLARQGRHSVESVPAAAPVELPPVPAPSSPALSPSPPHEGGPSRPPPRRIVRVALGGIVATVLVVVAANVALGTNAACSVTFAGQGWGIDYGGHYPSWDQSIAWNPSGSFTEFVGGSFTDTVYLTSMDYRSHNITSVTVALPFSLSSVSPSLPIVIGPGGSVTITLTVRMPPAAGTYWMMGGITTD
jgi:hypothetical protein